MQKNIVKMIRNGNITIPKWVRKDLNLNEGDYLQLVYTKKEIHLRKLKMMPE